MSVVIKELVSITVWKDLKKQELFVLVSLTTYYPRLLCNICLYIEGVTCEDGTVHLVGGNDVSRGRVEYCYEGTWYSVCASDWEDNGEEARVVCSTLGYNFGK